MRHHLKHGTYVPNPRKAVLTFRQNRVLVHLDTSQSYTSPLQLHSGDLSDAFRLNPDCIEDNACKLWLAFNVQKVCQQVEICFGVQAEFAECAGVIVVQPQLRSAWGMFATERPTKSARFKSSIFCSFLLSDLGF